MENKRVKITKVYRSSCFRWYITHPWEYIYDLYRDIRMIIERGIYGYARSDVWSLDYYLCTFLPSAFRELANNSVGCPPDLYDNNCEDDNCHEWVAILNEIADGLEGFYLSEVDFAFDEANFKKEQEVYKKAKKSFSLISKYLGNFWD